jgi:hypothetical protein
MKKIITIGEIVVEIMALETGTGFKQPIPLIGPFRLRRAGHFHRSGRQNGPALRLWSARSVAMTSAR